jgi:hypothetical protein
MKTLYRSRNSATGLLLLTLLSALPLYQGKGRGDEGCCLTLPSYPANNISVDLTAYYPTPSTAYSYFTAKVLAGPIPLAPPASLYAAWCVDAPTDIIVPQLGQFRNYLGYLYSSCDPNLNSELGPDHPASVYVSPATWKKVNYVLNHRDFTKPPYAGPVSALPQSGTVSFAYYWDVQEVINAFVGGPRGASQHYLPVHLAVSNALYTAAETYAADWEPRCGVDKIAAVANFDPTPFSIPADDMQLIILEVPCPCTSLGDYVWVDSNGNGIQDDGVASGLNGVTVNLFDSLNNLVGTTITANNGTQPGYYLFKNLVPGDYHVQFIPPCSYEFTTMNAPGSTLANDSNADAMGNTAPVTITYGMSDLTIDAGLICVAPKLNGLPSAVDSYQCRSAVPPPPTVTATDTCNNPALVSYTELEAAPGSSCNNTITRTWSATSPCGTVTNFTQTITVNDITAPTLVVDCTKLKACHTDNADAIADVLANSSATDNCDGSITPSAAVTGGTLCNPEITVTATDSCGKTTSKTCIAHVDGEAPTVTCPQDMTVVGGQFECPVSVTFAGSANDNCDGSIVPICTPASGSTFQPGETTVNCTATDSCGNQASCSFKVNVLCPAPLPAALGDFVWDDVNSNGIQDAGEPGVSNVTVQVFTCGQQAPLQTTATDTTGAYLFTGLQPGSYFVQFVLPPGYAFTAKDVPSDDTKDSDADISSGQTICVTLSQDETNRTVDAGLLCQKKPKITCPPPVQISCASQVPAPDVNSVTAKACCPCPTPLDVQWLGDVLSQSNCPNQFVLTRTYRATDGCGNTETCEQIITVSDTSAPVISCPGDIVAKTGDDGTGNCSTTVNVGSATATDNCGVKSIIGVRSDGKPLSDPYPLGITTIIWTASDNCNHSVSCTQRITVIDDDPPVIQCPANTVKQSSQCTSNVTYAVLVADNCSVQSLTCTPPSGYPFPQGTTTVNCTAKDPANNSANCSFTVTVIAPIFALLPPNPLPACDTSLNTLTGPAGYQSYSWSIIATSGPNWAITGPTNQQTVKYTVGSSGMATFQLIVTNSPGCRFVFQVTFACNDNGSTPGFWGNKIGLGLITTADFSALTALSLKDGAGKEKDFKSSLNNNKTALATWLKNRTAVNMSYMLSSHLACMKLNLLHGFAPGTTVVPIGAFGTLNGGTAITLNELVTLANKALIADGYTPAGDANRLKQEYYQNALANGNALVQHP